MGTWGVGVFKNDDALDWLHELEETESLEAIQQAVDAVNATAGYLEAFKCCAALAAAEIVAALKGRPGKVYPDNAQQWISRHAPSPGEGLVESCAKATERIQSDSELKTLWEETDEYASWQAVVRDLTDRLKA